MIDDSNEKLGSFFLALIPSLYPYFSFIIFFR